MKCSEPIPHRPPPSRMTVLSRPDRETPMLARRHSTRLLGGVSHEEASNRPSPPELPTTKTRPIPPLAAARGNGPGEISLPQREGTGVADSRLR